jgi:hypothetical protein
MIPEARLLLCVLSSADEPTRMITSAWRLCISLETAILPLKPTMTVALISAAV